MKRIKNLLVGAVLMAALFAVCLMPASVQAQARYDSSYTLNGGTAITVPGGTATNVAWVVDSRLQSTITLQIDVKSNTNGAYNIQFPIQRSGDGTSYTDTSTEVITFAAPAAYTFTVCTNINTLGLGWIKLAWLTNSAGTGTITNLLVHPILKRNAP